ncbi:hypothetical protein VTN31DRAFT_6369 [Thermomyces dupontii]|uniref:uncharacterized protein n=1 Tax=Talaromyces thermophilus TaxID=28565 RepID=UPI003742E365
MVDIKRLFSPAASVYAPSITVSSEGSDDWHDTTPVSSPSPAPTTPSQPLQPKRTGFSPDVSRHFVGIEKQFEQLHDKLHTGSLSSLSQLRYKSSSSPQHPRHVDVVEALFSFHRYRVGARFSPTTPFNEDVADRNLRAQATNKPNPQNRYSQLMSAIYQEDVADRNIAKSRNRYGPSQPVERVKGRKNSRSNSMRRRRRGSSLDSSSASAGRCRTSHDSPQNYDDSPSRLSPDAQMTLRPLASAPDLYSPSISEFPMPPSSPPATSQQRQLKASRPSPEDANSQVNGRADRKPGEEQSQTTDRAEKNTTSQSSSLPAKRRTTRSGSKKNVLDLSINTEIASARKPAIQIERGTSPTKLLTPRSITPRSIEKNASIAEIVNSPLPAPSPSLLTPRRSPGINFEDIMGMFKQACQSTKTGQESPAFETLQDTIVREINSHDAFRRVPVPDRGPPFTPPVSEDSFEDPVLMPPPGPPRIRRDSLDKDKESQFSKLIRKRSLGRKKSKNTSSTTDAALKSTEASSRANAGTRRRHTYAQPPSAEWLHSVQAGELKGVASRDTKSRDGAAAADGHNANAFRSYLGRRKSDPPPLPSLPPARQPQTSLSNGDLQQPNFSTGQRPRTTTLDRPRHPSEDPFDYHHYLETSSHPAPQHEQIRAVDDNNVTYILNATEPLTPLELITAAQQGSKKKNLRGRLEISRPRTAIPFRSSGNNKKTVHPIPGRQSSLQNGLG